MKYEAKSVFTNGSNTNGILPGGEAPPSSDTERNLALLPALMYISLMIVLGTFGNTVVCYVYGYKLKVTVTKQFILVLAVLDLANCLICAPTEMAIIFKIVSFDVPVWCKISRFLTYSLNGSTSLILLAIAVDRYCKVCRPLKVCFTKVRAKRFCIAAIVFSFFMAWPSLVLYGTKTITVGVNGTTCLIQDSYEQTYWPLVFYTIFFVSFLAIAITMITLYVIIAKQIRLLRKRQVERISNSPVHRRISGYLETPEYSEYNLTERDPERFKRTTDNNSNDNYLKTPSPHDSYLKTPSPRDSHMKISPRNSYLKPPSPVDNSVKPGSPKVHLQPNTLAQALLKELHNRKQAYKPGKSTLMLFLITVLFLLSFLPFFITAMIRGAWREDFIASLSNSGVIVFNIFIRSYLLSNAANPIIYSFCNSKFRQECRIIFCRCLKKDSQVEVRVEVTDTML